MKIAFYAPLKPISHPNPSGDQIIAKELVDFLTSKGHQCEVLSEFRTRFFYRSLKRSWQGLKEILKAEKKSKKFDPDLFFTYHTYYKAPDPIAPIVSMIRRRPYVAFEAMYSKSPRTRAETLLGYLLNRFALSRVTHVFSNMSDDLEGLHHVLSQDQISYLPPAVDTNKFIQSSSERQAHRNLMGFSEDHIIIASVAMLRPGRKSDGVEFLIRRLAELKEEGHRFTLIHAGGGEDLQRIKNLGAKLLGDHALFLGTSDRPEVTSLYKSADFFAFPGIDEGFGMVYIEAQSCSLPVVAFDNGGVPDAVDAGSSGFLTEFMDKDEYRDKLRLFITDKETRLKMGRQARAYVMQKHNKEVNYAKLEKICRRIGDSNGRAT